MPKIDEAIKALLAYQQADMEGVEVLASRQAIHEVADELRRMRTPAQTAEQFSLRWAAETVVKTFRDDEARGYHSRDRQYVIEVLGKALELNPARSSAGSDALAAAIQAKMADPAMVAFSESVPGLNEVGLLPVIKLRPTSVSDWIVALPSGREIGLRAEEWKAAVIPAQPQGARGPSEPLQCLRCGTVDAFGPVSPEKK